MPFAEASVSIINGLVKSGSAKTEAELSAFLRAWNEASVSDVQMNRVPFLRSVVKGLEMSPN